MDSLDVIDALEDVFEINDFTVVTKLEGLVASLESIFQTMVNWYKEKSKQNITEGLIRQLDDRHIYYDGKEYKLNFYFDSRILSNEVDDEYSSLVHLNETGKNLMLTSFDFNEKSIISLQFGVYNYAVITPLDSKSEIRDENLLNTILSAVNIATTNVECELPVFVQYDNVSRNLFFGASQNRNARTDFESSQIKTPLFRHNFLNGIIDLFKEKVGIQVPVQQRIKASIQFNYVHQINSLILEDEESNFNDKALNYIENTDKDNETTLNCSDNFQEILNLVDNTNSLKQLNLKICWIDMDTKLLNESDTYSDLDPFSAPKWFFSANFNKNLSNSLTSTLSCFLNYRDDFDLNCTIQTLIGENFLRIYENNYKISPSNAFNQITQNFSISQLNFFSSTSDEPKKLGEEQSYEHLLFNKAENYIEKCVKDFVETSHRNKTNINSTNDCQITKEMKQFLNSAKSVSVDSFLGKFVKYLILSFLQTSDKKHEVLACMWYKFVQILRNFWTNTKDLPGLSSNQSKIDMSKCLLQQKIEMIQYCITKKRERQLILEKKEEFFDAKESFEPFPSFAFEPQGRNHVLESGECLIEYPDQHIYVPITQDLGPMTEDMVEKHILFLSSLEGGSEARSRAQLNILNSDMEAFKAANPGCVLEDFVRWHSPRDFIPGTEGRKGELSERMKVEGSIWLETWEKAKPVPVAHQPRLFNETKEAEMILQSFERITIINLINYLLPVIVVILVDILIKKTNNSFRIVKDRLLKLCEKISNNTKDLTIDDIYDIRSKIETIETIISKYFSLKNFFLSQNINVDYDTFETELDLFLERILDDAEKNVETNGVQVVDAPQGALATIIYKCFELPDKKLQPIKKQYILRWITPRPGLDSRLMTHRLYASVNSMFLSEEPEFRLCGSFTSDITFK